MCLVFMGSPFQTAAPAAKGIKAGRNFSLGLWRTVERTVLDALLICPCTKEPLMDNRKTLRIIHASALLSIADLCILYCWRNSHSSNKLANQGWGLGLIYEWQVRYQDPFRVIFFTDSLDLLWIYTKCWSEENQPPAPCPLPFV